MQRNNSPLKRIKRRVLAITLAVAAGVAVVSMTGCAVAPAALPIVEAAIPPASLMQDCQHAPRPAGKTLDDLAAALISERLQLDLCNAQPAGLRAWAAGVQAASGASVATTPAKK